ncbi:MAG TPA: hypothetical protein VNL71_14590, partial [Chloroflexota bacterium]|nr:hypothetical protein [Chloroflexota bacterium]
GPHAFGELSTGTQQQETQLANRFNSDMITLGDTINQTLLPALLAMAAASMTAGEGLSSDANKAGNFLSNLPGAAGNFLGNVGGAIQHASFPTLPLPGMPGVPDSALYNMIVGQYNKVLGRFSDIHAAPDPTIQTAASLAPFSVHHAALSLTGSPFDAAYSASGIGAPHGGAGGPAPTRPSVLGLSIGAHVGQEAQYANVQAFLASATAHASMSVADRNAATRNTRGQINADLLSNASAATLHGDLAALTSALKTSAYTPGQQAGILATESFKVRSATLGPGDQLAVQAAQQNLDAAVQMGLMPPQLKQVQDAFLTAERKFYEDTEHGTTLAKSLRSVAQQGAVYSYQNQGIDLNRGIKDLQNAVSIDKLTGNSTAQVQAEQRLLAYQTQHAGVLKLDKSDLALLAAQYRQDLIATYPVRNIDPFFQTNQRLGNFEAGSGSTLVRGGGSIDPQTQEIRRLQQELNSDNREIKYLLAQIARNTGVKAQAAAKSGATSGRYSTAP